MNEEEINEMIEFIKSCNVCVINTLITEGDGKIALEIYKSAVNDLIILYEQEKEKNKELKKYEEAYKLLSYGLNNYISKDKIKEKIDFCKHQITFFKEEAGDYHNAELWEFKMKSYMEILEEK